MMMEAASISETSVNFYQTTRCNNPEDSHLQVNVRLWFITPCGLVGRHQLFGGTFCLHLQYVAPQR
jgi:hypothetical protein